MKIITIIFFILSSWHLLNFLFSRSLKSENKIKKIYIFFVWAGPGTILGPPSPRLGQALPGAAWAARPGRPCSHCLGRGPCLGKASGRACGPCLGKACGRACGPCLGKACGPCLGRACGRPFGPCLGAVALAWARPSAGPAAPAWAGPAGPLGFQETLAHTRVSETLVCRTAKTQGRVWRLGLWQRLGLVRRLATATAAAAAHKKNFSGNFKLQNFLCPLMAYIIF